LAAKLTSDERDMLAGKHGPGVQKALEIVVALGKIYGAQDLVPVESVQVSGVSYQNLGSAGLAFLREWANDGARVRVPTFLNPAGMDLRRWQTMGIDAEFARQQLAVIDAFTVLGIAPTCTCTPYLIGYEPGPGAHVAWAESSAVSFANSVLGARTNREGGPSALAAAICGRTARYGLHCDENRRASVLVEVSCPVRSVSDWGALGYMVGQATQSQVLYFQGLEPDGVDALKALGAAMAASGAVALYHVEGVTPEARLAGVLRPDHTRLAIDNLEAGYRALSGGPTRIDLVWLGCPHASVAEVARLAAFAEGRRFVPEVWITTNRPVREESEMAGSVAAIETAGGRVWADGCVVVAPLRGRFSTVATLSAKGAYYAPSLLGTDVRYGTWLQLERAMLTGFWE